MSATDDSIAPQARLQVVIDELRETAAACRPDVRKALEGPLFFLEQIVQESGAEAETNAFDRGDAHLQAAIRHLELGARCFPGSSIGTTMNTYVPLLRQLMAPF